MLLWIAFAVMTAGVLAAVLAPLMRPVRSEEAAEPGALGVYRHQLDELEAEQARGLIDATEAEAARVEVARRLLASAAEPKPATGASRALLESRHASTALAAGLLVPVLALALYLVHGSPDVPASPLSARASLPPEQVHAAELIARVEARLRERPGDGEGWDLIAPIYFKLGRFREAASAFASAGRLQGETAKRLLGFGEATVFAADGIVGEEARLAFERALALEPTRAEPRFWLALAKEQDGKLGEALAAFKALLAGAPADAPWRAPLAERIEELSRRLAARPKDDPRGPTAADVAAAQKLAPQDRTRMVDGMVEGLAARLKRDGKDLAGWQRLVNAYVVLGRQDAARAALRDARRNFKGDARALSDLAALAKSLGLGS
jgi:cytochrome c-type biogenesis protein CcmH